MNKRYYIAYGSNLNLPQMERRCPRAKIKIEAEIENCQLLFKGNRHSAVATIEPKEGSSVPVLIWELEQSDEKALDQYEGYPFFYHKEMMELEVEGEKTEAMVYIMNDGYEIGMPTDYYLNTILDGYESAGFDPKPLEEALEISSSVLKQEQKNDGFNIQM